VHRIDTADASFSFPSNKPVGDKPNSFFTHGSPNAGIVPTLLTRDILNSIQQEMANVISQEGITLDKADNTQLYTAVSKIAIRRDYRHFVDLYLDTVSGTMTSMMYPTSFHLMGGDYRIGKFSFYTQFASSEGGYHRFSLIGFDSTGASDTIVAVVGMANSYGYDIVLPGLSEYKVGGNPCVGFAIYLETLGGTAPGLTRIGITWRRASA
jgi:hypothetical protein